MCLVIAEFENRAPFEVIKRQSVPATVVRRDQEEHFGTTVRIVIAGLFLRSTARRRAIHQGRRRWGAKPSRVGGTLCRHRIQQTAPSFRRRSESSPQKRLSAVRCRYRNRRSSVFGRRECPDFYPYTRPST